MHSLCEINLKGKKKRPYKTQKCSTTSGKLEAAFSPTRIRGDPQNPRPVLGEWAQGAGGVFRKLSLGWVSWQ